MGPPDFTAAICRTEVTIFIISVYTLGDDTFGLNSQNDSTCTGKRFLVYNEKSKGT